MFTCPCCGYKTFTEAPGSYQICKVCFWEDDLSQFMFPLETGANKVSLVDAQKNFQDMGASEKEYISHVRPPNESDTLDPEWRPIDLK